MFQNLCQKPTSPQQMCQASTFQVKLKAVTLTGYQGFVKGIKAENMFGQTYGKITEKTNAGDIQRGRDAPSEIRYKTMNMEHHKDPVDMQASTVAASVGVNPREEKFVKVFQKLIRKQPIDPASVQKFWGIEEEDPVITQAAFEKNQAAFYGLNAERQENEEGCAKQTKAEAIRAFFAVSDRDSSIY